MNNKKAVFFDLDGTLTRMDLGVMFEDFYRQMYKHGVLKIFHQDKEKAISIYQNAFFYSVENCGEERNGDVFFNHLEEKYSIRRNIIEPAMDDFFANDFYETGKLCEPPTFQNEIIRELKKKGYRLVLATYPCFPEVASKVRLKWAGVDIEDFEYNTHYYNCRYYKPSKEYYKDILRDISLKAEECIMVGNDMKQDMCTAEMGFDVFFLKGYHIGENDKNYKEGDLKQLLEYAKSLPKV